MILQKVTQKVTRLSAIPQLNTPTLNEYIKANKIEKNGEYIYLYKGLDEKLRSPVSDNKLTYTRKKTISVEYADCDVWSDCSYGLSVSPTIEAAKEFAKGVIIRVKVHIGDVVCIPIYGHENKIRVKKLVCMGKVKDK